MGHDVSYQDLVNAGLSLAGQDIQGRTTSIYGAPPVTPNGYALNLIHPRNALFSGS